MIFGKYINKYYLKYWYLILAVFIFDIAVDVIQLLLPQINGYVVNILQDSEASQAFLSGTSNAALESLNVPFFAQSFLSVMLSISVIAMIIFLGRIGWRFFAAHIAAYIERDMRKEMYEHIQTLSLNYFKDKKVGGLLSYFTQDLQTIKQLLSEGFIFMTDLLVLGTLSFVFMFSMSWSLTLISAVPLIIFVIFGGFIGKGESKRYKIASDAFESLSDFTEENLQGFSVVKAFLKEPERQKSFSVLAKDTEVKNDRYLVYSSWLDAGINLFITVMFALLLSFGIFGFLGENKFFLGNMKLTGDFYTYIGYFESLIWPMIAGGILINEISMASGAYKRISTILDSKPEIVDDPDAIDHDSIQGNIEFSHLWFTYPDGKEPVIKDASFKVSKGMTVGIIGRTGSGKSTLLSLMQRLYNIPKKSIFIDGTDINYWKVGQLREHIGFVTQESFLFSGNIKDSIAFADQKPGHYDLDKIKEAAAFACIDKDIESFQEGYDTVVGERGATLSGGQRQRVSIARAFYKNPDVLFLDDSLSAVDSNTEKSIMENITQSKKSITTFIIAHRISALENCDLILVMDQGRIVGQGKHADLKENCPLYHDLCLLQELEKEVI